MASPVTTVSVCQHVMLRVNVKVIRKACSAQMVHVSLGVNNKGVRVKAKHVPQPAARIYVMVLSALKEKSVPMGPVGQIIVRVPAAQRVSGAVLMAASPIHVQGVIAGPRAFAGMENVFSVVRMCPAQLRRPASMDSVAILVAGP